MADLKGSGRACLGEETAEVGLEGMHGVVAEHVRQVAEVEGGIVACLVSHEKLVCFVFLGFVDGL